MTKTKNRFEYKGYRLQVVSQNIKVIYSHRANCGNKSYALSFDGGKTWRIGRNHRNIYPQVKGEPAQIIEICIRENEGNAYEE